MPARSTPGKDLVNSLHKMARILGCFSKHDRALTLGAIQARTGFPKATTHRLLATMRDIGFIEQDRDRDRYRLGLRLFELGSLFLANMDLHREAQAYVERLAKISGEAVHLCMFDGLLAVYVDRKEMDSGPSSLVMTIEGAPVYCTGVGKAILAFQDDDTVERVIAAGLRPFTDNTIVDPAALRRELLEIRSRGYSIDNCEHQRDLRCVGAPIRNGSGKVFASISVSGPASRMAPARIPVLAELVIEAADAISARLGFSQANPAMSGQLEVGAN